jgi:hypothetical protein
MRAYGLIAVTNYQLPELFGLVNELEHDDLEPVPTLILIVFGAIDVEVEQLPEDGELLELNLS